MIRVLTIVGTRPQFVKAATVSRALLVAGRCVEVMVHTGQHFDANMSEVFFEELEIRKPDRELGISGGSHGAMTGRMLASLESVMQAEGPDCVLVYGDTNSTLAGALAAVKLLLPVMHVEAGLRSFNREMPEEVNRVLTDHASTWLMSPTDAATANLRREGMPPDRIFQVGDVMYDAALHYGERAERRSHVLQRYGLTRGRYVLATIHRQENTDSPERLRSIIQGLRAVSQEFPVLLPLHPRTRQRLSDNDLGPGSQSLMIIPPVGYLDMIMLERGAAVVATDSGGVQKEAYFQRVPCVTLRDETEWVELVDLGWNRLAPPRTPESLRDAVLGAVGSRGLDAAPYGDGHAAERIASVLEEEGTG